MRHFFITFTFVLVSFMFSTNPIYAHCDGIDGPVVLAAKEALTTGNVNLVLIWVSESDEKEVRHIFDQTLRVRELNEDAKSLADNFFFESLVRIHRAGEGAPYTGLKPAGRDLGPAIPAADRAVASGSTQELFELLKKEIQNGLHVRFKEVQEFKEFDKNHIKAGRDFVKAYVSFLHYIEPLYKMAVIEEGGQNQVEAHNHK